jgi:hypothetical protein
MRRIQEKYLYPRYFFRKKGNIYIYTPVMSIPKNTTVKKGLSALCMYRINPKSNGSEENINEYLSIMPVPAIRSPMTRIISTSSL